MMRIKLRRYFTLAFCLVFIKVSIPNTFYQTQAASPNDLVISEVYSRGGRNGASYLKNYVTLYNPHEASLCVDDLALQYYSGKGAYQVTPLRGRILPKSHYLVSFNAFIETIGEALPLPDQKASFVIDRYDIVMALTMGIVPLVHTSLDDERIIDYLGIGGVSTIYGYPAPNPNGADIAVKRRQVSGEISLSKIDNQADFVLEKATPINSMLSLTGYLLKEEVENQCYTKYPLAKEMVDALSRSEYGATGELIKEGQYEAFLESHDPEVIAARLRYEAWARVHQDAYPYQPQTKDRLSHDKEKRRSPFLIILLFITFSSIVIYKQLKKRLTFQT